MIANVRAPFEVVEPRCGESPLVVEVPHAGLEVDAESLAWTIAPARSMAADADLHVDALFQDAPAEGATLLVARASRYVVDLNRGESDCDAEAVDGGGRTPWPRGLVWRLTTDGAPILRERLPRRELERRLELVYRPYHTCLQRLLDEKRARFGYALLLCGHSMPSQGRRPSSSATRAGAAAASRLGSEDTARADIVPGTRGRTTAAGALIDLVDEHARARGLTVKHDDPYRGGFSTGHYGKPDNNLHAIQIEIARRLYMDEDTFRPKDAGFRTVREFARSLVGRLARETVPIGAHIAPPDEANAGRT